MPEVIFPGNGQYVLFLELWPRGGNEATLPISVDVGPVSAEAVPPTLVTNLTSLSGDLTVNLKMDGELISGQPSNITFEVLDAKGQNHTMDVGVFSGFYINLYVVNEKMTTFMRPELVDRNNLQYSVEFPKDGKYKIWLEFIYGNRRKHQAAFVVDVK